MVGDFGVKYVSKEQAMHLKMILEQHYELLADWTGKKYVRLTINWDYNRHEAHISMPEYVQQALAWFQHHQPWEPQSLLHPHVLPTFGQKQQFFKPEDNTPCQDKHQTKFIQEVTGIFLLIASKQATPTKKMLKKIKQFLDYAATILDVIITYWASDMIITTHSKGPYLSEPEAFFHVNKHPLSPKQWSSPQHCTNTKAHHVLSHGSGTGCALHQQWTHNTTVTHPSQNGAPPTPNAGPDRPLDSLRRHHK